MTLSRNSLLGSGLLRHGRRGSVLLIALILSLVLALSLLSYLRLAKNALNLSHRSFFAGDARNLAEAGIEKALYGFSRLNAGQSPASAWAGWTLSGSTAKLTLPDFARDQNGVATVRVFVSGADGGSAAPYVLSQARITPFDGSPPVTKTLRLTLKRGGYFGNAIVALNGLTLNGQPVIDSFQSNASGNTTGPFNAYTAAASRSNAPAIVNAGSVNLGAQGQIKGNLSLGPGVSPPSSSQVTGTIQTVPAATFTLPSYPTAGSVSQSYDLGSSIPATLPVAGHVAASDGKFYYFVSGATLGSTTISANKSVVMVGTNTGMQAGLTISSGASLKVYIDKAVNASGNNAINNSNWAGALQIFTSTTSACSIGGNSQIYACLYAPNAALTCNGGGNNGMLVGSFLAKTITSNGHMNLHYDETLKGLADKVWVNSSWLELTSAADKSSASSLSSGYLD